MIKHQQEMMCAAEGGAHVWRGGNSREVLGGLVMEHQHVTGILRGRGRGRE